MANGNGVSALVRGFAVYMAKEPRSSNVSKTTWRN